MQFDSVLWRCWFCRC